MLLARAAKLPTLSFLLEKEKKTEEKVEVEHGKRKKKKKEMRKFSSEIREHIMHLPTLLRSLAFLYHVRLKLLYRAWQK